MDIVERLRDQRHITQSDGLAALLETCNLAAAEIEKLHAERDEAKNQLDSALHSIDVLEKRLRALTTWHRIDDPDNPPPKDGTTIIAMRNEAGKDYPTLIFFDDVLGWSGRTANDEIRMIKFPPTHWRWLGNPPLPTPPEVK